MSSLNFATSLAICFIAAGQYIPHLRILNGTLQNAIDGIYLLDPIVFREEAFATSKRIWV